jgi:penicillin amidase
MISIYIRRKIIPRMPKRIKHQMVLAHTKYVKKTIKVKDSSDVVLNVKITRHGPVVNDLIDGLKNDAGCIILDLHNPYKF